jgi:DNA-directed RNA polymerase subunit M/transcription elongation factor TFIIS
MLDKIFIKGNSMMIHAEDKERMRGGGRRGCDSNAIHNKKKVKIKRKTTEKEWERSSRNKINREESNSRKERRSRTEKEKG